MQQILVYGDSLSWGIIPGTRQRLAFEERWPGVAENTLRENGLSARVIENCLNGRRTVWEDPIKPGRNGLQGLEQVIEMHSPLALVVLILGCNDFQSMHNNTVEDSARGVSTLIQAIRQAPIEPDMPVPPILLVAQPVLKTARGSMAEKFAGGAEKATGLAEAYRKIADDMDCHFLDAGEHVETSEIDGTHLDMAQHRVLGTAIAEHIIPLLKF